jgi:transcription initiation factor TFIIB
MASQRASDKMVSAVQRRANGSDTRGAPSVVAHDPVPGVACPECSGQIVTADEESFCAGCGLVVATEWIDRGPTLADLGMVGDAGESIETVDPLQSDKGLHTTISVDTDGHGNWLSDAQERKYQRLRKRHRRHRFGANRKRTKRLNEALRDAEMIGGNLGLPDHVTKTAARYLRVAFEARVPSGRLSWEALAGGAVLYATVVHGPDRERVDRAVARYTKDSHERVCAAARAIRCAVDGDEPVRPDAVSTVLNGLDPQAISGEAADELEQLATHLLALGDAVPVGTGTPRLTVAAAAVYGADRLTPGKQLTRQQVVEAVAPLVETSQNRLSQYSSKLLDAYEDHHGTRDPAALLVGATGTV